MIELELFKLSMAFPKGSPEIPVGHPNVGMIGELVPGEGFRLKGMSSRSYRALLKGEISVRKAFRERGAINSVDAFFNKVSNEPFPLHGYKSWATAQQPYWYHAFRWSGMPGPGDSYPATTHPYTTRLFTSADQGALVFPSPAPDTRYIYDCGIEVSGGTLFVMLVDLLATVGGIPGNYSVQNPASVSMGTLPRYSDGVGVVLMGEAHVAGTFGGTTLYAVDYTNSAGVTGRRSELWVTHPYAYTITRCCPQQGAGYSGNEPFFTLQAGDRGCRKITAMFYYYGYQVSDSLAAVSCVKPLMVIPTLGQYYMERIPYANLAGLFPLDPNACLSFLVRTTLTSTRFNYILRSIKG